MLSLLQGRSDGTTSEDITPIPEPPGLPFIGNVNDIDREAPLRSFTALADKYGEVFRLRFPGRTVVFAQSHRLIDELCDEKRFPKVPSSGPLNEIRNGVNDGLFTARPGEANWGIAHRVLMPAFGPVSIRGMFDDMYDIATQMAMKWARYGPDTPINASDDFTRLALDTLALCSMGYRFNSYYTTGLHPFVQAMGDFLTESGVRGRRSLPAWFYRNEEAKFWEDIGVLRNTADEVLRARKGSKDDRNRKDLLNAMLNGVDPKTGQRMSDQSIVDNLVTFLIAGHETTSGTLSFAFHELLKSPEAYRKAQKEVDDVCGKSPITVDKLSRLPYITAVLKETLRLDSPITSYGVESVEETLLAGKYPVHKGEHCILFVKHAHLDPTVWGDDALEFKPERCLDENFNKLPKNAWKPFGNGARACIGRPFAMQEAILAMAMLLQNFNFVMDDPSYRLKIKQTLTIKPDEFYMRATLRDGLSSNQLEHRLAGKEIPQETKRPTSSHNVAAAGEKKPMTILYGSNSGTCEALAHRLASDASNHGFKVAKVDTMDAANGAVPKNQPTVFITASYEGQPPDNAAHFVGWVENSKEKTAFEDVDYAVFGVGHRDWASTFHRIPNLLNDKLAEVGATRIADLGLADVSSGDAFTDFETWEDNVFWPAVKQKYGQSGDPQEAPRSSSLNVSVTSPRTSALRQDVMESLVVATRKLTADGEPVKKHMEIALPSGETYRAGDYLAVLPINPKDIVERVMRKFHLAWDAHITIAGDDNNTSLPTNVSLPAYNILSAYVELSQPATKRNVAGLSDVARDSEDQGTLRRLATEDYEEVLNKRLSVIDLVEKFPSVDLPLGSFLAMLPPMRVRQYSISSSPLWNPSHVTLTFSVLSAPAKSGQGRHVGVASSYLDSLAPGDKLHVAVRPSHAAFHLPADVANTPILCIAAGTGIAPFRGFAQERAELLGAGRKIAPATLFFGCRAPGRDDLYAEELAEWERAGAVTVRRAYSRGDGAKKQYVQDVMREHKKEIAELWDRDARLYVCGSRAVGEAVRDVAVEFRVGDQRKQGVEISREEADRWWQGLRNARYATDVFD